MSKIATISAYAGFTRNLMRQHFSGNTSLHEHLMRTPELRKIFLKNNELTLLDTMKSSPSPKVEVEVDIEANDDQEWETILEWLESLSEIIG